MKNTLDVLVACEESQAVTKEFRKLGHNAFSCDILDCSGGHPEWHIKNDVVEVMDGKWDIIISFPPCTYLTVTGNRWFNIERYGQKAMDRIERRDDAIEFFMLFANSDCKMKAIENPVGIMSSIWRKPNQIIHPYQFGDPFEKRTCLWLDGLPELIETNVVEPEDRVKFKSGKTMPKWYSDAFKLPKDERARLRSKTFHGVAKAMAEQWSEYAIKKINASSEEEQHSNKTDRR